MSKNNKITDEIDSTDSTINMCTELLAENNLYEVYLTSRKIPFSSLNLKLLILFSVISLLLTSSINSENLAENIIAISKDLISVVLTVLGFLIAGYTIFCSVMKHSLSMDLYNTVNRPYGFSKLKYSHLLFMRVFFYYLVYTFFLIFIQFFSNSNIFSLRFFNEDHINLIFYIINYIAYNILFIGIIFLLLQLASFTFNIYHSVMTSICYTEINK